ncbi:MAG: hypothetical protein JST89_20310 [Cyanobacteria bacterium SZAS-4]|nr:hypothetical protein [Cyanobacteria bacterium SZAS-4]
MADDTGDENSAQDSGAEDNEAPKKSFGILAARFLQKGKSSPGSITGEFEALSPPNSTSSPDSQVRKLHPIDDEDEEIREGSIHGMEVPLSESLYADIGLDEMSNFDDPSTESSLESGVPSFEEASGTAPDVVYDIDAGDQPVISFGSGVEAEHTQDIEPAPEESTQYVEQATDYEEAAAPEYQYAAEEVAESTSEPAFQYAAEEAAESSLGYQYGADEVTSASGTSELEYVAESADEEVAQSEYAKPAYDEVQHQTTEGESGAEAIAQSAYDVQSEYSSAVPEAELESELDVVSASEEAHQPEVACETELSQEAESAYEAGTGYEAEAAYEPDQPAAFDASELDAIGATGASETAAFDKSVLDQIGSDNSSNDKIFVTNEAPAAPEKKGLLGKFAGKKDSSTRPLIGGAKKESTPDSHAGEPFDANSLDSIGTKEPNAGTAEHKGFDASTLDSIGTKGFDKSSLDAIGEPASPQAEGKDKPKTGGLLGGKFGQKAKVLGSEKSKLGGIIPPSTDPTFDQKETGRFMVNNESTNVGDNLTSSPTEDFSAPATSAETLDGPSTSDEDAAQPKEALSASFFDEVKEAFVEEEHIPVIGSDEIGRLITDADTAYRLKQYKAAEPIFAQVLEKLDKIGDDTDPLLPYCLDKMADNLFQMKKYKESLQFFRRLLVLHTKISSADRDMISTLYKIAQTSEALNLTSEADSMYKRAFRLGQQSLVPGDPLLAKVLEGYGTMLMRSEGAEPPATASGAEKTSDEVTAEKPSTLSAEEIAMLNSLGASADRAAAEASPIILGGLTEQSTSKARSPLKETDERADKARAESAGPTVGSAVGNVWIRLGVFIAVIAGLVLVTLNMNTDYSTHQVAHSKDFAKRVYKSLDGLSTFTIVSEDQAAKDNFGKHFVYEYRDWLGTPSDDMEVITGTVGGDNFVYEVPQGIKDASGFIYYDPHAPELSVTAKMRELGSKAQAFYKANGKYPEGKDLEKLVKSLTYKNPFGDGADSVTANSIAWPASIDASQIFIKSKFDTSLEDGTAWEGEPPAKPGQISAAASSTKQPDATLFCVHGRDRTGGLITRADGKVLVLIYKNGIDVTPGAADLKNEKPSPAPVQMRLSKSNNAINILTILLSYIPMIVFGILSVVFLSMVNKGPDRSKGFSVPTFGIIWAPLMVLLTGLAKFLPSPFSTVCLVLSGLACVGGLGWIGYKMAKTAPKKSKRPPPEASTM